MGHDSIRLLHECHYGASMAVSAIDAVLDSVHDSQLRLRLEESRSLHEALGQEAASILRRQGLEGRTPGPVTRGMAQMKTNLRMALRPLDSTAAALMSDGCHMGTKTLARQLNRLGEADVQARDITRRLIGIEDKLSGSLRPYL